jgi:ubiquitin C-terminal hydrolase
MYIIKMDNINKFCNNGNAMALLRLDKSLKDLFLDNIQASLEKYPDTNNEYNMKAVKARDTLLEGPSIDNNNVNGLTWERNSCYIDSVLVCLFVNDIPFINDSILNSTKIEKIDNNSIRSELNNIASFIRGGDTDYTLTCEELRKRISVTLQSDVYDTDETGDPSEFLFDLFTLFPLTNAALVKRISYYKNDDERVWKKSSEHEQKESVVREITTINKKFLRDYLDYKLINTFDDENAFTVRPGLKANNSLQRVIIYDTPFLIFYVTRRRPEGLDDSVLIPNQTITLMNGKMLVLYSCVVYTGGHYVSYYKHKDDWYVYNDIAINDVKLVGSYDDMLNLRISPIKYGVQFFYM